MDCAYAKLAKADLSIEYWYLVIPGHPCTMVSHLYMYEFGQARSE